MIETRGGAKLVASLSAFIKAAWHVLEPDTEYRHNWHIDVICEHLEAVSDGKIKRIVINVPPGHMKSLITCVFWPAWHWIRHPHFRYMVGSYAHDFSVRDHRKMARLVSSRWYQERFGSVRIERSNDSKLENSRGGVRHATSTGGVGTGERVNIVVHDDLLRSNDAHSHAMRNQAIEHCKAMSTRGADPDTFAQVMIMQRLHEEDPTAWAIDRGWELLSIPAEYDSGRISRTSINWTDPRSEDGDLLWPNHFTRDVVESAKKELGSYGYAAQFQQRPSPLGGGLIKGAWFRRYKELPIEKHIVRRAIFADTAMKTGERNDFTVFMDAIQSRDGKIYVLNLWRRKVDAPALLRMANDVWSSTNGRAGAMYIEDKASGTGLIQQLQQGDVFIPVMPVQRTKDKLTRLMEVQAKLESGILLIPDDAPWVADFISECEGFTADDSHSHDDQIDPMIDAVNIFAGGGFNISALL
ncbi:MAG: phage terminase large subunit [Shewanella oncorhynchi]